MARIAHIAIKVNDLEQATKFYEDVFGFRQVGTAGSDPVVVLYERDLTLP